MRQPVVLAVLIVTLLAGCLEADPLVTDSEAGDGEEVADGPAPDAASNATSNATENATEPLVPKLPVLDVRAGQRVPFQGACASACQGFHIDLRNAPDPQVLTWLEVRVEWDGTKTPGHALQVSNGTASIDSMRGFDAARVMWWDPATDRYDLHINGTGPFTGWVEVGQSGERTATDGAYLPDLVTLVPTDVDIRGCQVEERVEQGAQRCLRLSNAIGNVGSGNLEVYLSYQDAVGTFVRPVVQDLGHFVQAVEMEDGSITEHVVHDAIFHPVHGHFHYVGVAEFMLYEHDEATGLRGDAVNSGKKSGFCLLDSGEMSNQEVETAPDGSHAEQDCIVPFDLDGWTMGISRGFYDLYGSGLAEQYVDVAGVPDGVYELVSKSDSAHTLKESDPTNNQASVLIRITGDDVDVLEERGFYRLSTN